MTDTKNAEEDKLLEEVREMLLERLIALSRHENASEATKESAFDSIEKILVMEK